MNKSAPMHTSLLLSSDLSHQNYNANRRSISHIICHQKNTMEHPWCIRYWYSLTKTFAQSPLIDSPFQSVSDKSMGHTLNIRMGGICVKKATLYAKSDRPYSVHPSAWKSAVIASEGYCKVIISLQMTTKKCWKVKLLQEEWNVLFTNCRPII